MAIEHKICLEVVNNHLKSGENFSWEGIQKEVIKSGGILRISPGFTLGEFIQNLEREGLIEFDPKSKFFKSTFKYEREEEKRKKFEAECNVSLYVLVLFLQSGKSFTKKQLEKLIDKRGGSNQIMPNLSFFEMIWHLENAGIIKQDKKKRYKAVSL